MLYMNYSNESMIIIIIDYFKRNRRREHCSVLSVVTLSPGTLFALQSFQITDLFVKSLIMGLFLLMYDD